MHNDKSGLDEKSPLTPEATIFLKLSVVAGLLWIFVKLAGKIRKGATDGSILGNSDDLFR
jgi:hypothetical protein